MVAIDRILCPIDFSDVSRRALDHAAALARWNDAQLTVLHVFTPPELPPLVNVPELLPAALPSVPVIHALEGQLHDCISALAPGLRVSGIVEQGAVARTILAAAMTTDADLIVIGTHGYGGFDRLILGSVAEKVVRKSTRPVMTVPPGASAGHQPFKTIVCAVDFSPTSLSGVRYALAIAKASDARVLLVHVLEWPTETDALDQAGELHTYHQWRAERARHDLAALITDEDRTWCEPAILLEHDHAWRWIVRTAVREHADLIVLGVRGRNVVDLAVFGSTANQVVRQAPCPVLTLRH